MNSFLVTIILFTLLSCSYSDKDFNLNDQEKAMFASFRKGDTLYYESNQKDVDTILVLGIDSAQQREFGYFMKAPAHNDVWVEIRHLPVDTFVHGIFYDSITNKADTEYTQLFSIRKLPQEKKVQYGFWFRRFFNTSEYSIGEMQKDPLQINGIFIKDYYKVQSAGDSSDSDVEALYWTKNEGLVAYKYWDGTTWIKKASANMRLAKKRL